MLTLQFARSLEEEMISFSAIAILLVTLYQTVTALIKVPLWMLLLAYTAGALLGLVPVLIATCIFLTRERSKWKAVQFAVASFVMSDYFPIWNDKRRFEGRGIYCNQFVNNGGERLDFTFYTYEELTSDRIQAATFRKTSSMKFKCQSYENEKPDEVIMTDRGICYHFRHIDDLSENQVLNILELGLDQMHRDVYDDAGYPSHPTPHYNKLTVSEQIGETSLSIQCTKRVGQEGFCARVEFLSPATSVNHVEYKEIPHNNYFRQILVMFSAYSSNPAQGVCNFNSKHLQLSHRLELHTLSVQECLEDILKGKTLKVMTVENPIRVTYHGL